MGSGGVQELPSAVPSLIKPPWAAVPGRETIPMDKAQGEKSAFKNQHLLSS